MFEERRRKPLPAGRGAKKLPWGLPLLPPWTRALVARYFLATFSIVKKKAEVEGKTRYVSAVKMPADTKALHSLRPVPDYWRMGAVGVRNRTR